MIKVMIIDDEAHAIIMMEHLLKMFKDVQLLPSVKDSTLAKPAIEALKPDLLLLDIEMPKLNGFQLLQQFDDVEFKVIFTTAYDQYAIKALRMNALDYLLKPIDAEELKKGLDKFVSHQIFTTNEQIVQVNKFVNTHLADIIALSTSRGLLFIKIEDIMYFEAEGAYTKVKMVNGDKHLVSKTLSNFEEVLQDNEQFFRPHKSSMVNLRYVKKYIRGEGGELIMQDDASIVLSRNKKQEFLALFRKV